MTAEPIEIFELIYHWINIRDRKKVRIRQFLPHMVAKYCTSLVNFKVGLGYLNLEVDQRFEKEKSWNNQEHLF